ncbi:uncharacterized protein LOC113493735 [Trichoplusia ni]|uniref:Uncharacterized protein LOC113493735 n=1 Tax=Trichoplusia ni TaxID=7111 RepID=A0A7E5VH45_TRINI|nr:uncharacterized protein LOC113493735 [Trichoplusia ni]
MARIETYVFIDLETSGLPYKELNKTKITELSMVAISRKQVLETNPGSMPRVISKFTKCFNPRRMIDPDSTEVTGLCNDLLENETAFNLNVCNIINSYLELFQKPVCLIAQNGHTFDFPILKNHFELLNCALPDDILCADSLNAFYDLEKEESANRHRYNGELASRKRVLDTDNEPSNEATSVPNYKRKGLDNTHNVDNVKTSLTKDYVENDANTTQSMQEQNEKTPQRRTTNQPLERKKKVVRKLFFENDKRPDKSYKLQYIYERVLRRPPPEAHMAENDCVMAMEIAIGLGQRFVDWVADNHMPFAEVKAMKKGAKVGQ